jgi:PEP-CTERM motif
MQNRGSQVLLLFVCAILLTGVGFASNCPVTTLDAYLGSGYSCGIGDKTFSNFLYTGTSTPAGFAIPASGVGVTPITTPGNPGFQFSAGWFASTSSGIMEQDSLIQYTANVNQGGALITDLSLSIGGVGWTGTGSVVVDETACLGAVFPSCSGGQVITLNVFDSSAGSKLFDSASFAGVSEVDLEKDIEVVAGSNGSASVSLVTNQFSEGQVPEPGSLVLFGTGIVGIAGLLRRKLNI